jgi:uncharacterized alpha-E superfamily protein
MLSRAADSLYWMARNIERAETSARLIDTNLVSMLENYDPEMENDPYHWEAILNISGSVHQFYEQYKQCDTRSVINYLSFSSVNPDSILNNVEIARENARTIRGMIPLELWELVNTFYLRIKDYPIDYWEMENISFFFQMVKDQSILFQGIVNAMMSRGEAYTFLKMGKYLERAEKIVRILDIYYHKKIISRLNKDIIDHHQWSSVLHSVSGYEAYLGKYRSAVEPERVMEFLIFDDKFPRSIRFSVGRLTEAFDDMEKDQIENYNRDLYIALGRLQSQLLYGSIEEVLQQGFDTWVRTIQDSCYKIGKLICRTYYLGELDSK